jgi:hypothetical protein
MNPSEQVRSVPAMVGGCVGAKHAQRQRSTEGLVMAAARMRPTKVSVRPPQAGLHPKG